MKNLIEKVKTLISVLDVRTYILHFVSFLVFFIAVLIYGTAQGLILDLPVVLGVFFYGAYGHSRFVKLVSKFLLKG
jgi:hypothetical protein